MSTATILKVDRQRKINRELIARKTEALSIYRPQASQFVFHSSVAKQRLLFGGKRSGKTMACMMEFASIVTGIPIIGEDGKPIVSVQPYPSKLHPRIYWLIGWDVAHLGQTIYKNLFEPGMGGTLYAIKDKLTGKYRTFDRTNEHDLSREREKILAGPMIPPRMIVQKSWTYNQQGGGKTANSFSSVTLVNGAKIFAFPSSSLQAKAGDAVSGILIDEDIQRVEHFEEWEDRLGDEDGWMLWSVWPRVKNTALVDLMSRAREEEEDVPDPKDRRIEQFQLIYSKNKYMTKQGIANQLARMGDADSIARRDRGDPMVDVLSMYDFAPTLHCINQEESQPDDIPKNPMDVLRKIWATTKRMPPDWTRYLAIDPSRTRTACLSFAVPPPEVNGITMGKLAIVEWELIAKKHSAIQLAIVLKSMMCGLMYEEFIMDKQMGQQSRVGTDTTVFQAYDEAFKIHGLSSRKTLSGFTPGCNVPPTRHRAVRDALAIGVSGCSVLVLCEEKTHETQREFMSYRKKSQIINGEQTLLDDPANPRKYDAMSALEYGITHLTQLFAMGAAYVPPSQYPQRGNGVWELAQKMTAQQSSKQESQNFVNFGPGSGQIIVSAG